MIHGRKKIILVRKTRWMTNFHFGLNYPFKPWGISQRSFFFPRLMKAYLRNSHYTHLPVAAGNYNATPHVWERSSKWWRCYCMATPSVSCLNDVCFYFILTNTQIFHLSCSLPNFCFRYSYDTQRHRLRPEDHRRKRCNTIQCFYFNRFSWIKA